MSQKTVGIVGLGIMGAGMADNFLKNGHTVYVWNRTSEQMQRFESQGAIICESPADVASKAEVTFEVTANDESSRSVWTDDSGILAGADESKHLIASATLSAAWVDELTNLCKSKDLTFFDMPLTGGRVGAETGNLTLLVGGDEAKLEELKPTLESIAAKVRRFGEAGQGTRYKLLLNMLQSIHIVGFGEAIHIAEKNGMNVQAVGEALLERPGGVGAELAWGSYKNQPDPITFSVKWIAKDLDYAKQLSSELDAPLLDDVHDAFNGILQDGYGDNDWTIINEVNK